MRTLLKMFGWLVLLGVLGLAVVMWMGYRRAAKREAKEEAAYQADIGRYAATIEKDVDAIAPLAVAPADAKGDAGAFLNPKLPWPGIGEKDVGRQAASPPFVLPKALAQRLRGDDWLKTPPDAYAKVDLSWLAKLRGFAYWSIEDHLPAQQKRPERWTDLLARRLPDVLLLERFARVRLLEGIRDKDLASAQRDLAPLVRLMLSTEAVVPAMIGSMVLFDEAKAWRAFENAGGTVPDGVVPPTTDEVNRLRGAVFGSVAFVRLDTPEKYAHALDKAGWVACTAMNEQLWFPYSVRSLMGKSRAKDYARLDGILARHPDCRLPTLRHFHDVRTKQAGDKADACKVMSLATWKCTTPGLGRIVGREMMSMLYGAFDPFKRYRPSFKRRLGMTAPASHPAPAKSPASRPAKPPAPPPGKAKGSG